MRFHIFSAFFLNSLFLVSLSGGDALAEGSKPSSSAASSSNNAVYVGSGCKSLGNTSYQFYEEAETRRAPGKPVVMRRYNWKKVLGEGYCGEAQYTAKRNFPERSPISPSGPSISGFVITHSPAYWTFTADEKTQVAVAAYIPKDSSADTAIALPGVPLRKVRYTVFIEKPISDDSSTQEICSSKDIDQSEHANVFVDLGSCQMDKSDKIRVVLSFVENTGAGTGSV
jgi:hypothetical protein